jgi:hypothetical protein
MIVVDHVASGLAMLGLGEAAPDGEHPAADAVPGIDDRNLSATVGEVPGRRQTGETGSGH